MLGCDTVLAVTKCRYVTRTGEKILLQKERQIGMTWAEEEEEEAEEEEEEEGEEENKLRQEYTNGSKRK